MEKINEWLRAADGGRQLLVAASTGGHLDEMVRLGEHFEFGDESLWVTFDTPQSRSLLRGKRVMYLDYIAPRDLAAVMRGARQITRRLRSGETFGGAISTGSAIALSVLPVARRSGISSLYVESACRFDGPSLTGNILSRWPGIDCLSPARPWTRRWQPGPSVLGSYRARARDLPDSPSVLVTLGTIAPYRFDALVDAVTTTGLTDEHTTWQLGATDRRDLAGTVVGELSSDEFDRVIDESDVVITHAGLGNVLRILDRGKFPVVVPRRHERHEHVDDHQVQLGNAVAQAGIGMLREVDELSAQALHFAAGKTVTRVG